MGYRKWKKKGRLKRGFTPSLHLFAESEVLGARLPRKLTRKKDKKIYEMLLKNLIKV